VRNDLINQKLVAIVSKIKNKMTKCWKEKFLQKISCLKWRDYINSQNILKYSKVVIFTIMLKKYVKKIFFFQKWTLNTNLKLMPSTSKMLLKLILPFQHGAILS